MPEGCVATGKKGAIPEPVIIISGEGLQREFDLLPLSRYCEYFSMIAHYLAIERCM